MRAIDGDHLRRWILSRAFNTQLTVTDVIDIIDQIDREDPIELEIIRCKDCKHKPHTSDEYDDDKGDCGFEIIFPDYRCPCRCDDEYYNHIPDDDWYCGNAERRNPNECS